MFLFNNRICPLQVFFKVSFSFSQKCSYNLGFQTAFKIYSNKVISNSAPGGDKDSRSILAQQEGLYQSSGQESLLQNIYAQWSTTTLKST